MDLAFGHLGEESRLLHMRFEHWGRELDALLQGGLDSCPRVVSDEEPVKPMGKWSLS